MDLDTIKLRLQNDYYTNQKECIDDIQTVFNHNNEYNGATEVGMMGRIVYSVFLEHLIELREKQKQQGDFEISILLHII